MRRSTRRLRRPAEPHSRAPMVGATRRGEGKSSAPFASRVPMAFEMSSISPETDVIGPGAYVSVGNRGDSAVGLVGGIGAGAGAISPAIQCFSSTVRRGRFCFVLFCFGGRLVVLCARPPRVDTAVAPFTRQTVRVRLPREGTPAPPHWAAGSEPRTRRSKRPRARPPARSTARAAG